jgi:hypothetical protein
MKESELQQLCYTWFIRQYRAEEGRLWMQYNNPRSMQSGAFLKKQGMVSGVSDLAFIRLDGTMVFIELKVPKGKQSDNQKWWQSVVERCNSSYYIVRTLEEFQELINLNINKMSDNLKVTGKVVHIGAIETVSDKFKKRIIAVETSGEYPQTVAVEFTQDKCELLDKYSVNEEITIYFNLRGREWNGKYFTNLNGWRIESDAAQSVSNPVKIGNNDLPF